MKPTPEQQTIAGWDVRKGDLALVDAYAGTGKTTTLQMVAENNPDKRILYVCFNRDLATEARGKFPKHVECRTLHGLAYKVVGSRYRHKLANPNVRLVMDAMGNKQYMAVAEGLTAVRNFLCSDSDTITKDHLPERVLTSPYRSTTALQTAKDIWQEMQDESSPVAMPHDGYLKLWSMEAKRGEKLLPFDIVLLDEAQDSNPITLEMAMRQCDSGRSGLILVGDRHQSIYGWRNAVNAMQRMQSEATMRGSLTTCFRFGQSTADMASQVLNDYKDDPVELRGVGEVPPHVRSEAIVARTNAALVEQALDLLEVEEPFHFAATEATKGDPFKPYGFGDIMDMYNLYMDRKQSISKNSPVALLEDWDEAESIVSDEIKSSAEPEMAGAARMVKTRRGETPSVLHRVREESMRSFGKGVCLTSAHRSKGREWDRVEVVDGFAPIHDPAAMEDLRDVSGHFDEDTKQEINLVYVALTRSRCKPLVGPNLAQYFAAPKEGQVLQSGSF